MFQAKNVLCMVMIAVFSHQAHSEAEAPIKADLTMRASAIELNRPIWLHILLTNSSKKRVFILTFPPGELEAIDLKDADGAPVGLRNSTATFRNQFGASIEPGKSYPLTLNLSEWFAIVKPGSYSVTLRKHSRAFDANATTLNFVVVP